jgi:aryl-alcohol dehydrogenase-like predicted oxidoreductase
MSMSGAYGPADDNESIATLHRAFDLGINFLDTSASYGNGHNHELINKALKGRRERIVIHSKSGSPRTPDASGNRSGSSPAYLTQNCEHSVKRLGVDALDVFCMSRVDPDIPIEESVGAMAKLVERGLARYIGLSEASANSIRRARQVHPICSLQMEYSLWYRQHSGLPRFQYGLHGLFSARARLLRRRCPWRKGFGGGRRAQRPPALSAAKSRTEHHIAFAVRRACQREERHAGAAGLGLGDGARERHHSHPK